MKKAALRVSQPGNCCRSNGTSAAQARYTLYVIHRRRRGSYCRLHVIHRWGGQVCCFRSQPVATKASKATRAQCFWRGAMTQSRNKAGEMRTVWWSWCFLLHWFLSSFCTSLIHSRRVVFSLAAFIRLLLSSALYTIADALTDPTVTTPREIPLWLHD